MHGEPKTFWGKLAVLTAFIAVIAPVVGVLYEKGIISFPEWTEEHKLPKDKEKQEKEREIEEKRQKREEDLEEEVSRLKDKISSLEQDIKRQQQTPQERDTQRDDLREALRQLEDSSRALEEIQRPQEWPPRFNIPPPDPPRYSEDIPFYFFCASQPDFRGIRECSPIRDIRARNILEARKIIQDICTENNWPNSATRESFDEADWLHSRDCF
jgi:hypothetical protein